MPDLSRSDRIRMNRAVRDWLIFQLRQTERTIHELEREEEEDRRRREVARIETSWKLQPGRADRADPMLHRGNCHLFRTQLGYLDLAHVKVALEEFPGLEMCDQCAPWGSLGIPKPPPRGPGTG